ncbi:hypothetical protein [Plasmodium yoelii yoelii]|uniref:Uncharacterized protein n=1 Tax=Plasmodium yoelii yoelii TaxID=73239 RepID=Q7RJU5_PLAYO|nr:hypothetical protein [Plasmodium yoelii yoelii]
MQKKVNICTSHTELSNLFKLCKNKEIVEIWTYLGNKLEEHINHEKLNFDEENKTLLFLVCMHVCKCLEKKKKIDKLQFMLSDKEVRESFGKSIKVLINIHVYFFYIFSADGKLFLSHAWLQHESIASHLFNKMIHNTVLLSYEAINHYCEIIYMTWKNCSSEMQIVLENQLEYLVQFSIKCPIKIASRFRYLLNIFHTNKGLPTGKFDLTLAYNALFDLCEDENSCVLQAIAKCICYVRKKKKKKKKKASCTHKTGK